MKTKSVTLIICCLLLLNSVSAQYVKYSRFPTYFTLEDLGISALDTMNTASFAREFPTDNDKVDFKRLREFRADKQIRLEQLQDIKESIEESWRNTKSTFEYGKRFIEDASSFIQGKGPEEIISSWELDLDYYGDSIKVKDVNSIISKRLAELRRDSAAYMRSTNIFRSISMAINNIRKDISLCDRTIDVALAPEIRSQANRATTTFIFAAMVLIVIGTFFFVIFRRSGKEISTLLLSDGGLQFVTLFILIIAIILFGILNILEGKELAAILSGIAGYILGRNAKLHKDQPHSTQSAGSSDTQSTANGGETK